MAYLEDSYVTDRPVAANALPAERVAFIRKTYAHLVGAVMAFTALEALLLTTDLGKVVADTLFSNRLGAFVYMLMFVGIGMFAQSLSFSRSRPTQYFGLGLYVLLEAVIFLPLLYIAFNSPYFAGQQVVAKAALLTLAIFAGLSVSVFVSGKDFSFLGPILWGLSLGVIALLFCGVIFGFDMGLGFSFAMVGLAAAYIIYDTSNVLHRYNTEQYVGAALALFASVALLFWYILRIFMSRRS